MDHNIAPRIYAAVLTSFIKLDIYMQNNEMNEHLAIAMIDIKYYWISTM